MLRYTLDGREPDTDSMLFTGTVHLTTSQVIRVRAFKPGWMPSPILTRTYLIDEPMAIRHVPVVALAGDPGRALFQPEGVTSIVGGSWTNGLWVPDSTEDYNLPVKRGRSQERPVSFEVLNVAGHDGYQNDAGIRIAGSSRTRSRYVLNDLDGLWRELYIHRASFNLYFRNLYGDDRFECPLMAIDPDLETDSLRLRSGNNDAKAPFITDEMMRRLQRAMGQPGSPGTLATLVVNGRFKGYYNPVVRLTEAYFQAEENSEEAWDVMNHAGVAHGDSWIWNAAWGYSIFRNLSDVTHYLHVASMVDIDNFIDYLMLNIYAGTGDWPYNNY
ncbi:MAG: FN3 associated domain-containing protein, partial [Verrucomicrobiota bacterium]